MVLSQKLSTPKLCALLAKSPTSLSKEMHSAGFSYLGVPFVYVNVDTEDTEAAFQAMRTLGVRGYSLTIPHKERALRVVDSVSAEGQAIGAINTAVNDGAQIVGENTDWLGVYEAIREEGADVAEKKVLVLGAGGAARAAIFAVESMGARDISVWSRSRKRAEDTAKVSKYAQACSDDVEGDRFDIIINATPIGSLLVPDERGFPFDLRLLHKEQVVFDMVTRETSLLRRAREVHAVAISGIRMLLFQGLKQFEIFTGESAPREQMEDALMKEYNRITSAA